MKYIRTEDRIIELKTLFAEEMAKVNWREYNQSDAIEELCDEYVIISEGRHIVVHCIEDTYEETLKLDYSVYGDYEIYGSIWIGPDLHAVAKMNKKGDWELL